MSGILRYWKSQDCRLRMTPIHILLIGLAGPVAALAVTWYAALMIAATSDGPAPTAQTVSNLRTVPDAARLRELATIGVMYPRFDRMPDSEVLTIAGQMFDGGYAMAEIDASIRVPFEPAPYLFGRS